MDVYAKRQSAPSVLRGRGAEPPRRHPSPPGRPAPRGLPVPPPLPKEFGSLRGQWRKRKKELQKGTPPGAECREELTLWARCADSAELKQPFPKRAPPPDHVDNVLLDRIFGPSAGPVRPLTARALSMRAAQEASGQVHCRPLTQRGALPPPAGNLHQIFKREGSPSAPEANPSRAYAGPSSPSLADHWFSDVAARRKGEERSGFERLGRSLERLVASRLVHGEQRPESPPSPVADEAGAGLSARWERISQWIDQFTADETGSTLAARLEHIFALAYQKDDEHGRPHPNQVMTSVAYAAFDVLFRLIERYNPQLEPVCGAVRRELSGAIFVQRDSCPGRSSPLLNAAEPEAAWQARWARRVEQATQRTWYTAVRDLIASVGKAEEDLQEAERRRDKQIAATDRAITYWQMELAKVLLKGWKARRDVDKEMAEGNKREQRLAEQLAREKELTAKAKRQAAEERAQLELQLRKAMQTIDACNEQIAHLKEVHANMEREQREFTLTIEEQHSQIVALSKDLHRFEGMHDKFQVLCKDMIKGCVEGPQWEVVKQEELAEFASTEVLENVDERVLLKWVNRAAAKGAELCAGLLRVLLIDVEPIASFKDVFDLFHPYILILHWLAPGAVGEADLRRVLTSPDEVDKAAGVLECAERMGIVIPLSMVELATPHSTLAHLFLSATLFRRWADSGLAMACHLPQLAGPPGDAVSGHPLWPIDRDPEHPDEWRQRFDAAWERACRWRAAGAAAEYVGTDAMLGITLNRIPRMLTDAEQLQCDAYCVTPVDSAHECYQGVAALISGEGGDPEEVRRAVSEVIREHYVTLRKIYLFYSSSDSKDADLDMGFSEAWRLVGDAGLQKWLSRRKLQKLFDKANVLDDDDEDGINISGDVGPADSDPDLNPTEFVQLLMHMACQRYSSGKLSEAPLAEKLRRLLEDHILAGGQRSCAEEFKATVYRTDVQGVLQLHRGFAEQVFNHYVKLDRAKSANGWDKNFMRLDCFIDLVSDLKIVDSVLTHDAVRQLYLKLQDSSGVPTASFHEYLEMLCGLALFKLPAPYLPPSQRIMRFFEMWFIPMMAQQVSGVDKPLRSPMPGGLSPVVSRNPSALC